MAAIRAFRHFAQVDLNAFARDSARACLQALEVGRQPSYEGECVVTIRKHPNVYADCSALHYRPFQLYHSLMLLQEYGVWNKLLFGTDYPFTTVKASLAGMRSLNDMLEGTRLPRLNLDRMEEMFARDTLRLLGLNGG